MWSKIALPAVMLAFMGLFVSSTQAQRTATALPTVVNGFVVAITITDGGAGYANPPTVTISGGGGSGAIAVATLSNGSVSQIIVTDSGSGYTNTPTVALSSPAKAATGTATVVNGFVVAITVNDGGSGYGTPPAVAIAGGGGSGATAVATIASGKVDKIIVENAGRNYTTIPMVAIAAPQSASSPFTEGLVAYYPFNGNAHDESGTGQHGALHGTVNFGQDRFGKMNSAALFSTNQPGFVHVSGKYFPTGNAPRSLTFWIKPDYAGMPGFVFSGPGDDGKFHQKSELLYYGDSNQAAFSFDFHLIRDNGFMSHVATTVPWTPDPNQPPPVYAWHIFNENLEWHQISIVNDGTFGSLYFDGSEVDFKAWSINTKGNELLIGQVPWGNQYAGFIDDFRVYNRALSTQEIQDLYYYEAPEQPWLTVNVKTVQVRMHVKAARKYQLEASLDLKTWAKAGEAFVAVSAETVQEFDAVEVGRYFRLSEAP